MRKILHWCLASSLACVMAFGQEPVLKAPPRFSLDELARNTSPAAASRDYLPEASPLPEQAQQPAATPAAQSKASTSSKSKKKKWIIIAAVAGGAAIGVWAINKRLSNEGAGIF